MDRQKFIDHRGTRILFSDLSRIQTTEELQQAVRQGTELAQSQPPRSLLVLVDVTGTEYNVASFAVVQQSVAANRPYIRAHAVVGLPKTFPFRSTSPQNFPEDRWRASTISNPPKIGWFCNRTPDSASASPYLAVCSAGRICSYMPTCSTLCVSHARAAASDRKRGRR